MNRDLKIYYRALQLIERTRRFEWRKKPGVINRNIRRIANAHYNMQQAAGATDYQNNSSANLTSV